MCTQNRLHLYNHDRSIALSTSSRDREIVDVIGSVDTEALAGKLGPESTIIHASKAIHIGLDPGVTRRKDLLCY
jgi:hypothetical protein